MKFVVLVFTFISIFNIGATLAQETCMPIQIASLDEQIDETSALLNIDGSIFTLNDSGDEANLYQVDTISGNVLRTIHITNATNHDWEDLTQDDEYIYIGDFGNNDGDRTNLGIYKISKQAVMEGDDNIPAERIAFFYANQTDYTPAHHNTDFDCEAIVSYGDSLYIFTKNWVSKRTDLYTLPKEPGNYFTTKKASFYVGGLITAAVMDEEAKELTLLGYKIGQVFIWKFTGFQDDMFFTGANQKTKLQLPFVAQAEGICKKDSVTYYISAEKGMRNFAQLYRFTTSCQPTSIVRKQFKKNSIDIWPNPVKDTLYFSDAVDFKIKHVRLYDSRGRLVCSAYPKRKYVNVSKLKRGLYFIEFWTESGKITGKFIKR